MLTPQDDAGVPMQLHPARRSNWSTRDTTLTTTATDFALQTGTKMLHVKAVGANVYFNLCPLATDTVTTSSFDRAVLAGESRDIFLPVWVTTINAITDGGTVAPLIIEEYA